MTYDIKIFSLKNHVQIRTASIQVVIEHIIDAGPAAVVPVADGYVNVIFIF